MGLHPLVVFSPLYAFLLFEESKNVTMRRPKSQILDTQACWMYTIYKSGVSSCHLFLVIFVTLTYLFESRILIQKIEYR